MAFVFNIGRSRAQQLVDDAAVFKLLVLKESAAASVLEDLTTVANVLANASTTEADFTNYVRKTLAVTKSVNNTDDRVELSFADVVFTAAGGATNNTTVATIIYREVTGDADSIPVAYCEAVFTTDGNDVTLKSPAGGFYRSGKPAA